MVSVIINFFKVAGKATVVAFLGLIGAELGFGGGRALAEDIVIASGKAPKPVVVKTKGFGPWKKAVVQQQNFYTGEKYQYTVKIPKTPKAPKAPKAKKA